jgi:hypothetical protein
MRLFGVAAALFAVIALSIAAAAGAFGSSWHPARGAAPPPSAAELQKLGRAALHAATLDGDPHPSAGFVVPTTRRIADQVTAGEGSAVPNTPAYFVLLQGHFALGDVSVPEGAKAPTGTVLTLIFDRRAIRNLGLGVGTRVPELYAMGQPERLPLPSAG